MLPVTCKMMHMLDDLKFIHERDVQDALGVAEKQWQQLAYKYQVPSTKYQDIENVVVAGMGGSALAATLINSWPKLAVPYEVVRDYEVPNYIGAKTLFVASSYSGNTEEALAALQAAEAQGCMIAVIAAGGKLVTRATEMGYPLYRIPEGLQPRMAVFYNFAALVQLFETVGLIGQGSIKELEAAATWLSGEQTDWLPTVPAKDNPAKKLAQELMGKSPVIYAGPKLFPCAYKWKINFNENSKNVAWCNQLPEFNHNEFLGWTSHPTDKPYAIVDLRSNLENARVQKRFEVTERLLSGKRPRTHVVQAQGKTLLKQLLWVVVLGDFVSLYLALLNGLNPTPVDLIEKLKTAMQQE